MGSLQFVFLLFFYFLFQVSCFSPNSISSSSSFTVSCHPADSHALLLLKNSFSVQPHNEESKPKTDSWKLGSDCCIWREVSCDSETGYVIGLNLSNSALYGSLDSDNPVFMLSHLQYLNLSFNHFNGPISNSFENLTQIIELDLSYNNFGGPIPSSFRNLTQLEILSLSKNQITGPVPPFIGEFSYLQRLDLSHNLLNETIHPSLFTLPRLQSLTLDNNQFHGTLNITHIDSNSIIKIELSNNKLHGTIPSFQSYSLQYIDLSNNMFSGLIPSFQMTGSGSGSFFSDQMVMVLILSSNKLTGEVSSVCNLPFAVILDLSNNNFSGVIPPCLLNTSISLLVVDLGRNNFEGTIPDTFPMRCALNYLNLESIRLRGQIPQSITNCESLELINLSSNNIDDAFPYFLGILPNLQVLVLHSNKLHGFLKSFNASYPFSELRILDLSNNNSSGPLPSGYFDHFEAMMNIDLQQMTYMRSNQSSISNYSYEFSVNLTVKGLELTYEKIQNALTTVDLSGNKITEQIPESIGRLKSLMFLNLSHNFFRDNIPESMRNLTNLESLDLSSNSLSGRIPMELADLTFLQVFRVSHNRLEGPIPQGNQFNTFDNSSYEGNLGLCGFPLEECNKQERNQHDEYPSTTNDSELEDGFGWKAVAIGYGCGFAFGVGVAYTVFKTRKPAWFVRKVEDNQRPRKSKNKTSESRGRRK